MSKLTLSCFCSVLLFQALNADQPSPIEVQNEEGVIFERNLDGTETITAPDATRIKVMPAGQKVPQLRDTVLEQSSDGTDTFISPDGSEVKVREDGAVEEYKE